MTERICICGVAIVSNGRGRPRKFCKTCRPPRPPTLYSVVYKVPPVPAPRRTETEKWANAPRHLCAKCGGKTGYRLSNPDGLGAVCRKCRARRVRRRIPSVSRWECEWCARRCARPSTKGQRPKYCSIRCQQLACFYRRKARVIGAFVEEVPPYKVFEADGYRCHLCGKKTDPTKSVPHLRAPTIDHVVPLSKGGLHERANCRTACFSCNSAKQDRGGGEQFALVI